MKPKRIGLRGFSYFRRGYVIYFTLIIGVINVLTTTYFLAAQKIPAVLIIFPTFEIYVIFILLVGLPIVTISGWLHFKKVGTFSAEASINEEVNPFNYQLFPGFYKEVYGPAYLAILQINIKRMKGEKLTDEELTKIKNIEDQLTKLIEGGYVGHPPRGVF